MAEIKLEHVFKIYPNGAKAVDDFNLDIKDKEFVVFVGPSGCGKSTTLRMIAGLEEITGGKCYIGNKLVNFVQPKDRDIGMVFQNYALYPNMSVYSNLAFGLKMRKFPEPVLDANGNPIYEIDKNRISKEQKRVAYFDKKILDYENKTKQFTPEYMSQIQKEKDEVKTELDAMDKQKAKIIERKGDSKKLKALKKQYYNAEKRVTMARLQGANNSADAPEDPEIEYLKKKINELENQAILENPKFDQKKYNALVKKFNKLNAITYAFKDLEVINAMKEERENALKAIDYYSSTPVEKVIYKKKSKTYIHETIDEAAKILEIEEYLARKPKALSGGQRQRVAIGRAIVRHPKVFLMDEPLSNLDAKLRVQMRQEIIRIHKKVGATTIYVTHDQTEAMTMADRIVVMKLGVIQQIGEPRYLYNHPANLFVASFIGTPTINVTRLPYHDGAITFAKGHDIKLNAEQVKALKGYTDKRLLVGIRPEDITFNKKGKFEGKINIVEAVGSEKLIHFKTGDFELTAKAKNYLDVQEDTVVNFDINFDNIHVFDKNEKCIF